MPNEAVTPNTPGLIRLARAELAQTRANLCTHGVPVAVCRDHHAAATDQPDQETSNGSE